jgi:hypothetical protein
MNRAQKAAWFVAPRAGRIKRPLPALAGFQRDGGCNARPIGYDPDPVRPGR